MLELERDGEPGGSQEDLGALPQQDQRRMAQVGVVVDKSEPRAGTFVQMDNEVKHYSARDKGLEVTGIRGALRKYDRLKEYFWKAVPADKDEFTSHVAGQPANGYFVRALPGAKVSYPVQACLYLASRGLTQSVHNIVIAEEGSDLHLITGCTTSTARNSGVHLGVTEVYVKPGARVTSTMIHNWGPEVDVRPRTAVQIERGGVFVSNYVLLDIVRSVQMDPVAVCAGEDTTVYFNSVALAPPGAHLDLGGRVYLKARGARAEIISRTASTGGTIIARGYIEGEVPDVRGHLECRGLLLAEGGNIHAIPELKGDVPGLELSHEAAVGKIADEEVEYLMARGISRDEAVSMIVRGFLRVDIEGLPPSLAAELQRAIQMADKQSL